VESQPLDEPRNPVLRDNMKRLMNGRSIDAVRKAMAEAGVAIGSGSLHRALKGEGGSRLDTLEKISAFFDVSVDQLLQDELGRGDRRGGDLTPHLPGFEQISIAKLANAASMGHGSEMLPDDVVVGRLTLSPSWIARTLKPISKMENLRFIHGYGDSMEPTFTDGDILLVDAGVQEVKIDGIYVLEAQDRLFIKRVRQRIDGQFEISSDNQNVKTVDVLTGNAAVQVKGRVVWVWNGKKM
jgi:hypothetical protein